LASEEKLSETPWVAVSMLMNYAALT